MKFVVIVFAVLGFMIGLGLQSLSCVYGVGLCGLGVAALAVVPPWPMYARHPVAWLPVKEKRP